MTGYDIIFFWVIRMIFSGYEHMGEKPFKTVLFHGLVRDGQGYKMSKSLGNGIDPLEVIEKYGADALRLTLITGNAPGNDMRFYYERVENSRNFANKVWNASRFIMMNMDGKRVTEPALQELQPVDKWILSKLNTLVKDVTDNMESFELGIAVQKVYDFIWDEFCDWYIEMVKPRLYAGRRSGDDQEGNAGQDGSPSAAAGTEDMADLSSQNAALWTLKTVLMDALKLLHPFMPFITEEIFCTLRDMEKDASAAGDASSEAGRSMEKGSCAGGDCFSEESIMISRWPEFREDRSFAKEEKDIEILKSAVRGIRGVRSEMNVAPSHKAGVFVVSEDEGLLDTFREGRLFFASLAYAKEVMIQRDKTGIAQDAVSVVIPGATLYIPFAELVDIEQEKERLRKERTRLQGELDRVRGMLSNERFLSKAPESKVAQEKEKLDKYTQMMEQVEKRLEQLG